MRTTARRTRMARRAAAVTRRRSSWSIVAVVAAVVLVVIGITLVVHGRPATRVTTGEAAASTPGAPRPDAAASRSASGSAVSSGTATATPEGSVVEVPALVGGSVDEAKIVLQSAGLSVGVRPAADATTAPVGTVLEQTPAPGTVAAVGDTVVLTVAEKVATPVAAVPKAKSVSVGRMVVVIDPGHQARSNSKPEPIGPGSTTMKPAVSGGTTGVSTKIPESEIALQISMNLKKRLEARGLRVVMTRTTNDVNIANSQRALIANDARAALFVRVHCDGSTDSRVSGISTLYPESNVWTKSFAATSKRAARIVQTSVISSTGAVNRGTVARGDMSGFNWSKVPCVLVECGFMSNRVEDKLLASPYYQDKIAEGLADGIVRYTTESAR